MKKKILITGGAGYDLQQSTTQLNKLYVFSQTQAIDTIVCGRFIPAINPTSIGVADDWNPSTIISSNKGILYTEGNSISVWDTLTSGFMSNKVNYTKVGNYYNTTSGITETNILAATDDGFFITTKIYENDTLITKHSNSLLINWCLIHTTQYLVNL